MECPYCKAENRDGVRYCGSCGKFIGSTTLANVPAPAPNGATGPARSLVPGSRLQGGRYVVKRVLGQGGMGAALLATDLRLDSKPVVIKELISENVDPAKLQEDVRNFKREVAMLAHIDHPLVPNVTDHFQEGTRYFMVQEYVDGENLEERLNRTNQPMKEREVLICASEILDILDYLAQQTPPVVHRDIKPANIIIGTRDKRAHLVDFGIARAEVVRNSQRKQTSALGTPGYAPPEQYQGNADPRSDLYALAATLHHLLTNRDPRNHPPFTYPPVRALNPQLSPEIENVLTRALINDPNQRYQSAAAMKQDIDNILRQRFGISGNIDSFTLGSTSGAMQAAGSYSNTGMPTAPSIANQPTHISPAGQAAATVVPTSTPVQALPHLNALSQGQVPSSPPPPPGYPYPSGGGQKRNSRNRLWIIIGIIILVLLLVGAGVLVNAMRQGTGGSGGTGIGVTKVGNEYIGISDGSFAFDTARTDGQLKQQAAAQLKQNSNNTSTAMALLSQATEQDTSDAEAHIYLEDLRVETSGDPYITLVVATMLTGNNSAAVGVGRDDLQGAYIAQKEFNDGDKLQGGLKVRLLIANAGSNQVNVTQVAQRIVQLAQSDKTFVGVMGWPYSGYTIDGLKVLGAAHIPLVSQTASSDQLTGASPYFFRVAPSNRIQGVEGANYAEQVLHAHSVALFYDPANSYTQSLAQDFAQQFKADGNNVVAQETYTVGKPDTIPAKLQDALTHNPDFIYFAGYADDVSTLLINLPPGNMPVMGGDALYELGGYSSIARGGFTRLRFTTFSYPDEWDVLGYSDKKPAFFSEYPAAFDPGAQHQGSPYGFTRADNDAMLSYDATAALLTGCNIELSEGKKQLTPQDLRQGLTQVNGANSFQGVSGQIAFDNQGNPVDKAIVILSVDPQGHIKWVQTLGRFLK